MPRTLYVLGHKNPDSDSICSAIGYAALLQAQGQTRAVAARQGPLRPETAYVLERFGVPVPPLVTDVRPRVADVMSSPAVTVPETAALYEVGQILQTRGIRAVPVVDGADHLCGVIGVEDFARSFIAGLAPEFLDHVPVSLANVQRTLGGRVLVAAPDSALHDRVMVGAMEIHSMLERLEPGVLLVMGDRTDAQRAAIEFGVGALIITGDHPVAEEILELARQRQIGVISVPHHTYTSVRLIHLSTAVRHVMRREVVTCSPDDLVEDVREALHSGPVRVLVVIDPDRSVVGMVSGRDLLRAERPQIVLVDHNERGQAVTGIEEADVVGVIDHHRVADFQTRTPPFMRLEPVGASSTIIGKLFAEAGIAVPPPLAGVLLAGILADTLLFRGPTTTPEDRRVAADLARRAGVDPDELGTAILTRASNVADRTAEQLLLADFKEFRAEGRRFGIGVIETASGEAVLARRAELLATMEQLRGQGPYSTVVFAIVDILHEQTTLLVEGYPDAVAAAFNAPLADGQLIAVPGILSRKKNIVPLLGTIAQRIPRH
jgi:manganese-dependent inorganic pyrophosphatase